MMKNNEIRKLDKSQIYIESIRIFKILTKKSNS